MKRIQKKMLLDMYDTLRGAVAKVNKAIKDGDAQQALGLLSACQESAVTIGTFIEELAGEGTEAVKTLEIFCEEVYNVSVVLGKENADDTEIIGEALNNSLSKMVDEGKKIFDDEIKVSSKVVFLPIDPKWWDGFQTVWEKESADELTEVYVVPIPWYEQIPGVEETKVHYDISAYPEAVKALDYRAVNLAQLHPDVIYIQDANDGHGLGRNVGTSFFTGVLKNYTDDLTYIPYELQMEPDLKNRDQVSKVGKKVLVNGLMNLNTVIVQSPVIRNVYIRTMKETYGTEDVDLYESMIRAEGSPRAERIKNLGRDDVEVPKEWEKYVLRSDGSRKKLILYSNSLFLFMDNGHNLVDKLKDSMKVFRENCDDVAVVWRPHPRTGEILEAMRPEYVEEYKSFVDEFKAADFGIYDDSEDFARAIVLSDAYYGDDGAMVALYKATGKPIMIENLDIRS